MADDALPGDHSKLLWNVSAHAAAGAGGDNERGDRHRRRLARFMAFL
jgi:hypothetical protein